MPDGSHEADSRPPAADALRRTLAYLGDRLEGLHLRVGSEEEHIARQSKALLRVVVVQARVVEGLARTPIAEAAYTNLRALFEAWLDLRVILKPADRREQNARARRAMIFACEQMLRLADKAAPTEVEVPALRKERERLRDEDSADPHAYRYGTAKSHWSGFSRTHHAQELAEAGFEPSPAHVYSHLSLIVHHETVGLSNVREVDVDGERRLVHAYLEAPESAGNYCSTAAAVLTADAWRTFCAASGVDPGPLGERDVP